MSFIAYLLCLFLIVPMPIAGGVPILIGLTATGMLVTLLSSLQQKKHLSRLFLPVLITGLLLFIWEAASLSQHSTRSDILFVASRLLWLIIGALYIVYFSNLPKDRSIDVLSKMFTFSLCLLIGLMLIESIFYPAREVGRQLGTLNLPFPRATGIPQSDGKIGVYMCLALTYFSVLSIYRPSKATLIGVALAITPILFTQSRSTLLAMAFVAGPLILLCFRKSRGTTPIVLSMVLFVVGFMLLYIGIENIYNILRGEGIYAQNVDARSAGFNYGLELINRNKIFGQGAAAIIVENEGFAIHNTFLVMAVKSGAMAGVLLFLYMLTSASSFSTSDKIAKILVGAAIFFSLLTEHMLYPGVFNEHLWLGAIVGTTLSNIERA